MRTKDEVSRTTFILVPNGRFFMDWIRTACFTPELTVATGRHLVAPDLSSLAFFANSNLAFSLLFDEVQAYKFG